jgi:hypothetical protein
MPAVIEARGIVNRFGRQVVHDGLDLEVAACNGRCAARSASRAMR